MKKRSKYKIGDVLEGTYGKMQVMADFLPSPAELAKAPVHIIKDQDDKRTQMKITVKLHQDSMAFFKNQAKRLNTTYEIIISRILEEYAKYQSHKS